MRYALIIGVIYVTAWLVTTSAYAQMPNEMMPQEPSFEEDIPPNRPYRDPRSVKDTRGLNDPRDYGDPRSTRDKRGTMEMPNSKDPRDPNPASVYSEQWNPQPRKTDTLTCGTSTPKACKTELDEANRLCDAEDRNCNTSTRQEEDKSCTKVRCDISKALCSRDALDNYVLCLDKELEQAQEQLIDDY